MRLRGLAAIARPSPCAPAGAKEAAGAFWIEEAQHMPRAAFNECAASARAAAGRLAPSDATCLGEARRKQRGWPLGASDQQGSCWLLDLTAGASATAGSVAPECPLSAKAVADADMLWCR
jgi:hypothetical protein